MSLETTTPCIYHAFNDMSTIDHIFIAHESMTPGRPKLLSTGSFLVPNIKAAANTISNIYLSGKCKHTESAQKEEQQYCLDCAVAQPEHQSSPNDDHIANSCLVRPWGTYVSKWAEMSSS